MTAKRSGARTSSNDLTSALRWAWGSQKLTQLTAVNHASWEIEDEICR